MLAEQGAQIVFVPFWTDTKNGYQRVRICSQSRAIENECYVAIGGSVGNLPRVDNVDIQYAQSAVFSPSDIYFPHDATLTEASANTEMIIFADVDLTKLKQLNTEALSPTYVIAALICMAHSPKPKSHKDLPSSPLPKSVAASKASCRLILRNYQRHVSFSQR